MTSPLPALALRRGAFVKRQVVSGLCLEDQKRQPTLDGEEGTHD